MRRACLRLRVGLLCGIGVTVSSDSRAQATLSQIAYTGITYYMAGAGCNESGPARDQDCVIDYYTFVVTPWTIHPDSSTPTWSPDASRIAFGYGDIIVMNATGGDEVNLTNDGNSWNAAWSPDGWQIAFLHMEGRPEIYLMNPDGSGRIRVTENIAAWISRPAWSPDGARLAFTCQIETNNNDICVMNRDGTGVVRLTIESSDDSDPEWSPDGARIVFSTTRFDGINPLLGLMNADGTQVRRIGSGIQGWRASWSPDGAQIAFHSWGDTHQICSSTSLCLPYASYAVYTTKPDGTDLTMLVDGGLEPAWMPARVPVASFRMTCEGATCHFDGSASADRYGQIVNYTWNFGDGETGTDATVDHAYVADGTYSVTLTVKDDTGGIGTNIQRVIVSSVNTPPLVTIVAPALGTSYTAPATVNITATADDIDGRIASVHFYGDLLLIGTATVPPYAATWTDLPAGTYVLTAVATDNAGSMTTSAGVPITVATPLTASFSHQCAGLTCTFDGSISQGDVTGYMWSFGDGRTSSQAVTTHKYGTAGSYSVTLTVTDSRGARASTSETVTVPARKGGA